ncbi:MAG TPA: GspH/FimT family pseudopilin [Noviherbaspirillum sp.]
MRAAILHRQRKPAPRHAHSGFTLIELMITIVIAGILASVALPSYRSFVAGQRIKTAAFDLTAVLYHARTEALKRNADVTVSAATGGWQNGWTMTVGTTVISSHEAFPGLSVTAAADSLVYRGNGRPNTSAASFSLSAAAATASRCITVSLAGLPASRSGACS